MDRETILCAGVFGSPQLLMLSGIGPTADLRAVGVTPLIDLPVGRNLRDHLSAGLSWARREQSPFQRLLRFDRVALAMARALLLRDGPATTLPTEIMCFVKLPTQETNVPDIEFLIGGGRPQDAPHLDSGFDVRRRRNSSVCVQFCCIHAAKELSRSALPIR